MKNYYEMLGVNQNDSQESIRKAYRSLAKKYHPDLNPGDKTAEIKMREIGEAWEILGDETKRDAYDQSLLSSSRQKASFSQSNRQTPNTNRPMTQEDFFRMTQNFESMFAPEAIKNSADASQTGKNPIDTSSYFEHFMGFNESKKKQ